MSRISRLLLRNKKKFLGAMFMVINSPAIAVEDLGASIDCSDTDVHFVDQSDWTPSERLEAMDKAFFDSINRFELCNLSSQSTSTSASGNNQASNASGDTATDSTDFSEDRETGFNSVASPSISGTDIASPSLPPSDFPENIGLNENSNNNAVTSSAGSSASSGTKPEDIPDADNDDLVAAQIRRAAEIEQDPVKKAKLWHEYRKYKGLPVNDK